MDPPKVQNLTLASPKVQNLTSLSRAAATKPRPPWDGRTERESPLRPAVGLSQSPAERYRSRHCRAGSRRFGLLLRAIDSCEDWAVFVLSTLLRWVRAHRALHRIYGDIRVESYPWRIPAASRLLDWSRNKNEHAPRFRWVAHPANQMLLRRRRWPCPRGVRSYEAFLRRGCQRRPFLDLFSCGWCDMLAFESCFGRSIDLIVNPAVWCRSG